MNGPAGPPPPPPPPPFIVAGATPPVMPEPVQARPAPRSAPAMPLVAPPAALAGAMMKDKKPFTYTPGGLDLSEIRSPRMQRRLSRNAALEGARPSPLAQHSSTGSPTPGSSSPSVPSGLAVQVLPMPGMAMARTTPATPPPAQTKEPVVVKKSVCGPPPPPPPFAISSGDFKLSPPETKSIPSGPKTNASPPLSSYVQNEPALTTPSSPPFSSPPSDPRSPSLSLASTNSNDSGTNIPAPPPPPPQSGAARRASIIKNGFNGESTPSTPVAVAPPSLNQVPQSQAPTKSAEASESKGNNAGMAAPSNISPNSFGESDTSRSRESSSMAVEDSSTSFREESATLSVISNVDRPEDDMEHYNSNESLLKQISALEQITAKHHSKQESSSGLRSLNGNDRIGSNTPERQAAELKVQPILRLSTASKQQSSQQQQEEEARRKEFEQQEHRRELQEQERQRQFEEHERQVQFEEQERQRQFEERERHKQIEEEERLRQLEEQERRQRQLEEEEHERRLHEERQQEMERQKQQELERQKQQELERQKQQELERQRQEELEHQRQQEFERKREQEQIERQREAERKKQQEEQERLRQQEESRQRQLQEEKQRQLEAQRQQELENQKLREEQEWQRHQQEEEQMRIEEQERQRQQVQQQLENQNRFKRQGSVPIQVRQTSFRTDSNQQQNQVESQGNHQVRASSATRSPNVSPTSGLVKAPLPWMSAIPRRETSAPPEFVNYAQTAQSRLQQQRAQRQQSFEQGKAPQAPSPVLKEAVVVSPPVVYQHPGQSDFGRSTLPRNTKLNSGPAQRPWVAKHQQYQQQQQQQTNQRPSYQQPQRAQQQGPGQRWPEVKPPSYLRQQSASQESNLRTITTGGEKVRIIPIMVEQDSSSDQEQQYFPSSGSNATIRSVPINSSYGPSYQPPASGGNTSIPPSPRTPQTPPSRGPLSSSTTPPSQRWNQQPSFISPPQQAQQQRLPMQQQAPPPAQQPQKVNYNNPIGLYSDGNAVEALQQMQQSLAQLNTGLQNAYPKFIQETISNSLPTRSVSSPGPGVATAPDMNSAPMQSRSFRILQNVVDSEASGSEDELRGYLPQDYAPDAYHTAQVKTFTGGAPSPRGGAGRGTGPYAPSPLAQQGPQQYTQSPNYAKYRDDADVDPREPQGPVHIGMGKPQQQPRLQHGGSNSGAIPSRAFRALQQHTYGGPQEEAGPGESDL